MEKNIEQSQQCPKKCYSVFALSKTTICRWYADFQHGRTDTNDAEHSCRSNEAVISENINQVLKIVMNNRKLKVCEIAEMVNISTGSAPMILQKNWAQKKGLFPNGCHI